MVRSRNGQRRDARMLIQTSDPTRPGRCRDGTRRESRATRCCRSPSTRRLVEPATSRAWQACHHRRPRAPSCHASSPNEHRRMGRCASRRLVRAAGCTDSMRRTRSAWWLTRGCGSPASTKLSPKSRGARPWLRRVPIVAQRLRQLDHVERAVVGSGDGPSHSEPVSASCSTH